MPLPGDGDRSNKFSLGDSARVSATGLVGSMEPTDDTDGMLISLRTRDDRDSARRASGSGAVGGDDRGSSSCVLRTPAGKPADALAVDGLAASAAKLFGVVMGSEDAWAAGAVVGRDA